MKLVRTLALALIILLALLLTNALVEQRTARAILAMLSFGAYLPVSLATAAAMTNVKGVAIGVLLITMITVIPCSMTVFAHAIVPVGAGILLGTALQHAINESREEPPGVPRVQ